MRYCQSGGEAHALRNSMTMGVHTIARLCLNGMSKCVPIIKTLAHTFGFFLVARYHRRFEHDTTLHRLLDRFRFAGSQLVGMSSESITADLAISPHPQAHSLPGSVASVATSAQTSDGWQKVPTKFLPDSRLIAVFPPTEESTIESKVVGT